MLSATQCSPETPSQQHILVLACSADICVCVCVCVCVCLCVCVLTMQYGKPPPTDNPHDAARQELNALIRHHFDSYAQVRTTHSMPVYTMRAVQLAHRVQLTACLAPWHREETTHRTCTPQCATLHLALHAHHTHTARHLLSPLASAHRTEH